MAYIKVRKRIKHGSVFDIIHTETASDVVLRFSSTGEEAGSVESALVQLENDAKSNMKKVDTATNGHLAAFGDAGAVVDSGKSSADFAAASHSHAPGDLTGFTPDRVVVTTGGGVTTSSGVTTTEIGYLSGLSENVQDAITELRAASQNHILKTEKGASGGVVPLESDGKIATQYLPSFVSDVIEGTYVNTTTFNGTDGTPLTLEAGKMYVDTTTNRTYRWSGTVLVAIGDGGVELGNTSATAFRGDYGQIAYNHSQAAHARVDATATAKSGTNGNVLINGGETAVYRHPGKSQAATSSSQKLTNGGSFTVPICTFDALGHIKNVETKTYTLPAGGGGTKIYDSNTQPSDWVEGDLWQYPLS